MKRLILIALGVTLVTSRAHADEANDNWKKEMETRIEALTKEVERNKLPDVSADTYAPQQGMGPAASKIYRAGKGVSLGGYGEIALQAPDHQRDDGAPSGQKRTLDVLRAVLYAGYKFTDKILFNSEIEFEHSSSGEGSESRGEVSVEFAYLDFLQTPWLGIRAGKLLMPIGLTNELHEPTVFHGVLRPSVERNIIPTTWTENGTGIFGDVGPFSYRTYVVAGLQAVKDPDSGVGGFDPATGIRDATSEGFESKIENLAWVGRLDYHGLAGSVFGGSVYTGHAGQKDSTPLGTEVTAPITLWETHATAQYYGVELRGLYVQGTVGDVTNINAANGYTGTASAPERFFGGYTEIAYDVLSPFHRTQYLAPFFRYERYDSQQRVPAGFSKDPANSRREYTFGLTFKPIPNIALKADWQNIDNQANTGVNQFNMGVGYLF